MPTSKPTQQLDTLVTVFNQCFADSVYRTRLQGGGDEPVYIPAQTADSKNTIVFTKDYFSSALHEISHWCIAGDTRRNLVDYGYWYAPDGRTAEQQSLFEKVEIKPQALEWIFHRACARGFRVSADNLVAGLGASENFKNNIFVQTLWYCENGINKRAARFARALAERFGGNQYLQKAAYTRCELD